MSDKEILKRLIANRCIICPSNKRITLNEPRCPASSVSIRGLPDDAIIIKTDEFDPSRSFFNDETPGLRKRADFAIVSFSNRTVVLLELKKDKSDNKTIIHQLIGARCVIALLEHLGKLHFDRHFFDDYNYCYISVAHSYQSKKKTSVVLRGSATNITPEHFKKILYPKNICYSDLI